MQPMYRTEKRRWARLRTQVLLRDGYSCKLRLSACTQWASHVDHIIPVSSGGTDELSNLQAACRNCNLLKGAGFLEQQMSLDASPPDLPLLPPLSGDYTRRHSR